MLHLFLAAADTTAIPNGYLAMGLGAIASWNAYMMKQVVNQSKINERVTVLLEAQEKSNDANNKRLDRVEGTLYFNVKHPA